MKLKDGYMLSRIAGKVIAVPTEGDLDLGMMISLNETSVFLWERLQNDTTEEALVSALLQEYNVDETTACKSVTAFVKKLQEIGILE